MNFSPVLPGTVGKSRQSATLGVMGGGQLGRMFVHAAQRLGYNTAVLDADPQSPAGLVSHHHIQTDYNDAQGLAQLANFTVNAGSTITLNPSVSDPDNQNTVPGDNNVLTVQYTGFMSGPTKGVSAADAGLHTVTISLRDNGLPVLSQEQSIQILVFADSDHDGIPDDAELANGLNPNNAADALLDPDNDGIVTLFEYAFGTNPAVANGGAITVNGGAITQRGGPAMWLQTTPTGADFRVLFGRRKGALGINYTVQFSPDLVTWENSVAVPAVLATDAEIEAVTVPYTIFVNGRKAHFFRVQVSSQ